jgi:hypothetical protein
MNNVFSVMTGLRNNIFGGGAIGSTTPIARKSAIEMNERIPTGILGDDPFQFSMLSYPRDVTNDRAVGHYMLFYVNVANKTKFKYNAAAGGTVGGVIERKKKVWVPDSGPAGQVMSTGKFKTVATYEDIAPDQIGQINYNKGIVDRGGQGNVLGSDMVDLRKGRPPATGLDSVHKTTTRITDSVAIYLPPNVQDSTSAAYNGYATGVVGLAAAGGFGFVENMRRNDFEAAASGLIEGAKGIISEVGKRMLTSAIDELAGTEGTKELINKAFGQADNPYMEVLFDKMALRQFTYNFTFAPRNEDERDDVQRIIQLFRFHMAPELKGVNNRFLTLPSTFDIHYMYQMTRDVANENPFYHKIATCVLESCNVDYTPGGVKSFRDGSPTQITMALGFKETELLTKERINQGY